MASIIVCYDLPVIMRVARVLFVLPLIGLILSCSPEKSEPAAPAKVPDERAAIAAVKEINQAQADYIRRTRRYAQSFNELIAEHLLQGEPAEDKTGYKFALYPSPDAGSYTLKATPSATGARHFFTDQSGVIRAEADKPATAESPAVTE
jgi:hypothetical protein